MAQSKKSIAEEELALQLRAYKIEFRREVVFHPTRKWRLDFAIGDIKLAVEVEGITSYGKNKNGTMRLGRHQTAKGIQEDMVKYGEARVLGWDVYRCSPSMVESGYAISMILKLIELKKIRGACLCNTK